MKDEKIRIYVKPTCTTCRKALKILKESEVEFENINYFEKPFNEKTLTQLIKNLGIPPKELLRKRAKIYKDMELSEKELTYSEIIGLMVKYPELLQRPIIVRGDKAILARPVEEINGLL